MTFMKKVKQLHVRDCQAGDFGMWELILNWNFSVKN